MVGKCLSNRSYSFSQERNDCWLPHLVLGNFKQELSDQWPKPFADSFSLHCSQILFALVLKGNRGECVGEACPQPLWLSSVLLQAW